MKSIGIDTNVLLSLRLKRQPGFAQIDQLFQQCLAGKLQVFIPEIVLPEIEWVLRTVYKQQRELVAAFLYDLLQADGIMMEDKPLMKQAVSIFRGSNFKFTDCVILTQIQSFGPDEFLTFDENLKKIYQEDFSQN